MDVIVDSGSEQEQLISHIVFGSGSSSALIPVTCVCHASACKRTARTLDTSEEKGAQGVPRHDCSRSPARLAPPLPLSA